jgi:CRISPR/Cas system-associated exonuclease Cas4 (RecB family)
MNLKNNFLNVTDITNYFYCPRKFYLEKIKGLKKPPNKKMIEGMIRHKVIEVFSNLEEEIVKSIKQKISIMEIISRYKKQAERIIKDVFQRYENLILKFKIPKQELYIKMSNSIKKEIRLRAESVEKTMQRGFLGKRLWKNLFPKYISELYIESEKLMLKGKVDRVMFADPLKQAIIPFELKTRESEKI